ncbi:hypothetical protein [Alishewanella sp. SMS8]|uniref:hypothetical protein n=1 Tax=Alishewanella sp. SMS8 TaxID=2994676 RepID=UPI0027407C5D|nr:hypothetical protein [Alishewanella sp. SMS8]MDP5460067.1 hypothetical protein [Alishewanella sp. SMS8]
MKFNFLKTTLASVLLLGVSVGSASAAIIGIDTTYDFKLVADNDFALFSGTESKIEDLLFQNNFVWGSQINQNNTQFTYNSASPNSYIYIVALGGGGQQENISGMINGVKITDVNPLWHLFTINTNVLPGSTPSNIASGAYSVQISDLNNLINNSTAPFWSDTLLVQNSTHTVIQKAGFGAGYTMPTVNGLLLKYQVQDFNINARAVAPDAASVPTPSTFAIFLLGLMGLGFARLRKAAP